MVSLPLLEGDIVSLTDQIRGSDAYQIQLRLQTLATNYYVFERNYQELMALIDEVENPISFSKVWAPDKNHVMQQVMRETARLLQNLVASAKSLVEHTRRLIREWYRDTDFFVRYQAKVDGFVKTRIGPD